MPYIIFISAFFFSLITVPPIKSLAQNKGILAHPGKRHFHTIPTPKFGGIAVALSVLIVAPFIFPFDKVIASYLAASAVMLLTGIVDDVKKSGWIVKLLSSLAATSILVFAGNIWITSLGNLLGTGEILLGVWGIPFTYFCIFGIINAINLMDGLDGLASGISSLAFLSFAIFAFLDGNTTVFYLSLINLGATLGFFRYNYPKAKIFLGDSGSLFLGFSLAAIAILLTQGGTTVKPMIPVMILGIPIFDTIRVMIFRVIYKKHPFHGDKTHFHHLLVRSGIPSKRAVKTIWALSGLICVLAFLLHSFDSWLMFLISINISLLIGIFIENLRIIKTAKRKINGNSNSLPLNY